MTSKTPKQAAPKKAAAKPAPKKAAAKPAPKKAAAKPAPKKAAAKPAPKKAAAKPAPKKAAAKPAPKKAVAKPAPKKPAAKPAPKKAAAKQAPKKPAAKPAPKKAVAKPAVSKQPVRLLAGGNPQIAKADGDAPVQAYIAALPGWKRDAASQIDSLIARCLPDVKKAVKWNSPFYGVEGQGWFLSFHAFAKYIKLGFFRGALLKPLPPGESKNQDTRYLHVNEQEPVDEKQLASWVKQAAKLPGWMG